LKDLRRIKFFSATWQKPMPWRSGLNCQPAQDPANDGFDDPDEVRLQTYFHVHVERQKELRR
jgi:hypothetical protein